MIQKTDKYFYVIGIGVTLSILIPQIGLPILIIGILLLFFDKSNQINF